MDGCKTGNNKLLPFFTDIETKFKCNTAKIKCSKDQSCCLWNSVNKYASMAVYTHTHARMHTHRYTATHTESLLMPLIFASHPNPNALTHEDLAMTFKQLLCPLLVVNRVAKNGWNIERFDEKKLYKLNTGWRPLLTCAVSMACLHAFKSDTCTLTHAYTGTHTHTESHAEVSGRASDRAYQHICWTCTCWEQREYYTYW